MEWEVNHLPGMEGATDVNHLQGMEGGTDELMECGDDSSAFRGGWQEGMVHSVDLLRGREQDVPEWQTREGYDNFICQGVDGIAPETEKMPRVLIEATSGKHSSGTPVLQVSIPLWRVWPDVPLWRVWPGVHPWRV